MAALTTDTQRAQFARPSPRAMIVKNASVLYVGSLVGLEHSTGHVVPLDDAADRAWVGIAAQAKTGDGTVTAQIYTLDTVLKDQSVTGYSTDANNNEPVYATDDGTGLTLTRPTDDAVCIGYTLREASTGKADVALFSQEQSAVLGMAGSSRKRLFIGCIGGSALLNTTAQNVLTYRLFGHGNVVATAFSVSGYDSLAVACSQTLQPALVAGTVTTNISGGALLVEFGDIDANADLGVVSTPATAITGTNEFYDGDDLVIIRNAGGTAATAGIDGAVINLYVDVEYLP